MAFKIQYVMQQIFLCNAGLCILFAYQHALDYKMLPSAIHSQKINNLN